MFELDLLVRMKIMISDDLNTQLENGDEDAYKALESYLIGKLNMGSEIAPKDILPGTTGHVTKLQIEDAGPYNDAGQWVLRSSMKVMIPMIQRIGNGNDHNRIRILGVPR